MTYPATDCRKDDWKPVVLTALTDLGPDGSDVRFRDVLSHVETDAEFPGWDTWGTKMKKGKPYPVGHRMITLAALALKGEGVITSDRRGYYRLVCEAAAEVVEATEVVEAVEIPDPTVLESVTLRVVPDLEPVVTEPVVTEPEPVVEGPVTHPLYAACERARRVAIEATRCFGFYAPKSKACATCPLAGLCHSAKGVKLAEAAERLDAKAAKAAVEATEAVEGPYEGAGDHLRSRRDAMRPTFQTLVWDVTCSGCSEVIHKGTPYRHIDTRGAFHPACV